MSFNLAKSTTRTSPGIAMVMGLQNEERFLREHLLYHHAIGIDRAYLFFDRCTDGSLEIAQEFSWVRSFKVDPGERDIFIYNGDFQRAAMDHSLQFSREEGIEWLLSIDPDEFAYANNRGLPDNAPLDALWKDASLKPILANQPEDIDQVRLPTREILPSLELDGQPFYDQVWFHGKKPFPFQITNPVSGETEEWKSFFGHSRGKAFVRTARDVQAYDPHSFTVNQGVPPPNFVACKGLKTVEAGWHAHYPITSVDHWMEKFEKLSPEPRKWVTNFPVEFAKQTSKDVRSHLPRPEAEAFCRETFFLRSAQAEMARAGGMTRTDRRLKRMIESLVQTSPAPAGGGSAPEPISLLGIHLIAPIPQSRPEAWDLSPPCTSLRQREGFSRLRSNEGQYYYRSKEQSAVKVELGTGYYRIDLGIYPYGTVRDLNGVRIRIEGLKTEQRRKDWIRGTAHARFRVPPSDSPRTVVIRFDLRGILKKRRRCPIHFIHLTREAC